MKLVKGTALAVGLLAAAASFVPQATAAESVSVRLKWVTQAQFAGIYVAKAKGYMKSQAGLLKKIEARYGVQPEVVLAIWGMETGFGANSGNKSVFGPLATLAYDCRRSAYFTNELDSALEIAQKGYISASQMKGAGFGELGQTQFLPSKYLEFAVDFDGDGRRDLIHSRADVLASTANFLRGHGWQPGAGYEPGQPNYAGFAAWNRATVYQQALALFASKIAQ